MNEQADAIEAEKHSWKASAYLILCDEFAPVMDQHSLLKLGEKGFEETDRVLDLQVGVADRRMHHSAPKGRGGWAEWHVP